MKKAILYISLIGVVTFFLLSGDPVSANLCPSNYTDRQCYDYLLKKQSELSRQKGEVDKTLKNVRYQEGDIKAQLDIMNAEIQKKELEVNEKQVLMEMTNIEIRNVGNEIASTKTKIDTIKQETNKVAEQIEETTMLSYKVNTIPSWYLLASNDLITTLEMMKYFDYVVKQEKSRLNHYNQLQTQLASEQKVLTNAQSDIIEKRNDLEKTNLELIKLRNELKADSEKKTKLLADLEAMERKLEAQKAELTKQQNNADAEATSIAIRLFQEGRLGKGTPVSKGAIIGFQGHTGCAFGSHLHFGIIKGKGFTAIRANVNPFTSGYLSQSGGRIYSGSGQVPVNGALITQGFHEGYALDIVSTSEGNQTGARYFIRPGDVKCAPGYGNVYHGLRGEGAPVRAMLAGTIYRGNVDRWGSNYIIIDHGNDLLTYYFHLK
jgi:murein DD-endopeptidase MepM/ murein hydrolase activator NlpD/peptidoglycan hydrolase CwlO-like protein